MSKHKVFISYHHKNDQAYKEALLELNDAHDLFIDQSVDSGGIDDDLPDQRIREIIRDDYLRDTTVTVLLVGTETARRKHIDWEIYSSMYNGTVNKQSGVLVINLPSTGSTLGTAAHGDLEKKVVYPEIDGWSSIDVRTNYEERYPYMPARIVDNLMKSDAKISVVSWDRATADIERLRTLIDLTFDDRQACEYDLSRPMRRANS